jgi:hypothetical protein
LFGSLNHICGLCSPKSCTDQEKKGKKLKKSNKEWSYIHLLANLPIGDSEPKKGSSFFFAREKRLLWGKSKSDIYR